MIVRIYGVRDRKSDDVPTIFTLKNDALAKRYVSNAIPSVDIFRDYPSDFELLCFGEFDTRGLITAAFDVPEVICCLDEFPTRKNGGENE